MAEPLEKTFLIGPFVKEKREELGYDPKASRVEGRIAVW